MCETDWCDDIYISTFTIVALILALSRGASTGCVDDMVEIPAVSVRTVVEMWGIVVVPRLRFDAR